MGVAITGFRTKHKGTRTVLRHRILGRLNACAVKVSGNRRVTFTCAGKDMDRVDYEDHH